MNITNTQRAYIELHIAVMLFGFTAILGDLIQLPSLVLVWWRWCPGGCGGGGGGGAGGGVCTAAHGGGGAVCVCVSMV